MKERPILFSGSMVRAILDGRKTQTRRALKVQPLGVLSMNGDKAGVEWIGHMQNDPSHGTIFRCKFGKPVDTLWVRETWARDDEDGQIIYRADIGRTVDADDFERNRKDGAPGYRWKPSIHMPRLASRILLEVVAVRVERLNDISESDAIAEGVQALTGDFSGCFVVPGGYAMSSTTAKACYARLWESINGPGSWDANPWVWVVEFTRVAS